MGLHAGLARLLVLLACVERARAIVGRSAWGVPNGTSCLPADAGTPSPCMAKYFRNQATMPVCPQYNFLRMASMSGRDSANYLDAENDDSTFCKKQIAANPNACATQYCPDITYCYQAGGCDSACNFCSIKLMAPLSKTPPCAQYSLGQNSASTNYLDAATGASSCAAILSGNPVSRVTPVDPAYRDCFTLFCPTCPMAHQCDAACGYCRTSLATVFNTDTLGPGKVWTQSNAKAEWKKPEYQCAYSQCMPEGPYWQLISLLVPGIASEQWRSADDCTASLQKRCAQYNASAPVADCKGLTLSFDIKAEWRKKDFKIQMNSSDCGRTTSMWKLYQYPDASDTSNNGPTQCIQKLANDPAMCGVKTTKQQQCLAFQGAVVNTLCKVQNSTVGAPTCAYGDDLEVADIVDANDVCKKNATFAPTSAMNATSDNICVAECKPGYEDGSGATKTQYTCTQKNNTGRSGGLATNGIWVLKPGQAKMQCDKVKCPTNPLMTGQSPYSTPPHGKYNCTQATPESGDLFYGQQQFIRYQDSCRLQCDFGYNNAYGGRVYCSEDKTLVVPNDACVDINECQVEFDAGRVPCHGHGTCTDSTTLGLSVPVPVGQLKCNCDPGYTSPANNCTTDINECASSPCQNSGTCQESSGDSAISAGHYHCECPIGYSGNDCENKASGGNAAGVPTVATNPARAPRSAWGMPDSVDCLANGQNPLTTMCTNRYFKNSSTMPVCPQYNFLRVVTASGQTGRVSGNYLDAVHNDASFCKNLISSTDQGHHTCAGSFCPDPKMCANAGQCDAACSFCTSNLVAPLINTPPCASYSIGANTQSLNYLDAVTGTDMCASVLAGASVTGVSVVKPSYRDCFSLFCPTCPMAHQCDAECGFCRADLSKIVFKCPMAGDANCTSFMQSTIPETPISNQHQCAYKTCMPTAPYWQLMQAIGFPAQNWRSAQDCADKLANDIKAAVTKFNTTGSSGIRPVSATFTVKEQWNQAPLTISFAPSNCNQQTTLWKLYNFATPKDCVDKLAADTKLCPTGVTSAVACPSFQSTVVTGTCTVAGSKCAYGKDPTNQWAGNTMANDRCPLTSPGDTCTLACEPGYENLGSIVGGAAASKNEYTCTASQFGNTASWALKQGQTAIKCSPVQCNVDTMQAQAQQQAMLQQATIDCSQVGPVSPTGNFITFGQRCQFLCGTGFAQSKASLAASNNITCQSDRTIQLPYGLRCVDQDECQLMSNAGTPPCNGHGTCVDSSNGAPSHIVPLGQLLCTDCDEGWSSPATNCSTDIDECHSNPCQNAGTCLQSGTDGAIAFGHFHCDCPLGYTGNECEHAPTSTGTGASTGGATGVTVLPLNPVWAWGVPPSMDCNPGGGDPKSSPCLARYFTNVSTMPVCPQYNFMRTSASSGGAGINSGNYLDAKYGDKTYCSKLIKSTAAGHHTCEGSFCPDPAYCPLAGQCNSACSFCTPALIAPLSKTPPCATYHVGSNAQSLNYLDAVTGQASCAMVLAGQTVAQVRNVKPTQRDCFSLFCPTCPMAHQCDSDCGFCRSSLTMVFTNDMKSVLPETPISKPHQCACEPGIVHNHGRRGLVFSNHGNPKRIPFAAQHACVQSPGSVCFTSGSPCA